jgi:hypothetical protein
MPTEPPRWHPIMSTVEGPPGTFRFVDPSGREYGVAELRRVSGQELRYRVTYRGELLGWSTTARLACERIHAAFLSAHGPSGGPIASWGER